MDMEGLVQFDKVRVIAALGHRICGHHGVNRKKKYSDFGKMKCSKFGNKSTVFSGTTLQ
jgi:hypothetical protein